MININELKFDKDGLIPAVVVDAASNDVLMLAYMNEESLRISINEEITCFWSRSRNELWRKGETSGNTQDIISIKTDCDMDTLLISVVKAGPACHTGAESCFYEDVFISGKTHTKPFSLEDLHDIINDRKINKKQGSYTNYLFEKGLDKILKKFGEEATEVIIAAKSDNKEELIYELSDLIYHALVLMTEMGITPDLIKSELKSRHSGKEE
ncbi:MAG: bifunctional phosphoribosyl-AMP cyclohydrolase/phosphoribosyl-ATP diphosphatase HisIE [Oscillospiraceae bacterium]|nr:bifunctional phosphoribosyl-AMP cyclohydrolase/phosphoribosyl-ATP diphosphatase HisIE [Oscillospiraceae bacterium]